MKKDKEIFERMKLLTNYNPSKTLNENKQILFEQSTINIDDLVTRFNETWQYAGTDPDEMIKILYSIPDRNTFIKFHSALMTKTGKMLYQIINSEFEQDNHKYATDIARLLKDRFNINADSGVKIEKHRNVDTPIWKKQFRIIDWGVPQTSTEQPSADPNKKDGYDAYMATVDTNPPAPATPPAPAAAPQKFDDVLNGRGVLKLGSKSPAVGELQQKLIKLGYTTIVKPTDYYGNLTKNAVVDFQTKQFGKFDGIVGPQTAGRINQIINQPAAAPTTTPNDRGLRTAVQSYTPKGVA